MLATHLNPNLFNDDVETVPNRNGYGEGLRIAGEEDARVVALCADLTSSTKTNIFAEAFPDRFLQTGIGEQSMASLAAGMALMGKIPFIASYAMFSPGRNWEQIRTTIAYNGANVKMVGAHSGISVGPDGATHQAIEDIALMRVIPRMTVLSPCDALEASKATRAAATHLGPVYIRLAREATPVITTTGSEFVIGKAQVYLEGDESHQKKVGIIATGTILYEALVAGKILNARGVRASVMNLSTIKPLDKESIHRFAKDYDALITVEEHQAYAGMGSAVSEYLAEVRPTRVLRVGIQDVFGQSGTPSELLAYYGLNSEAIVKKTIEFLR